MAPSMASSELNYPDSFYAVAIYVGSGDTAPDGRGTHQPLLSPSPPHVSPLMKPLLPMAMRVVLAVVHRLVASPVAASPATFCDPPLLTLQPRCRLLYHHRALGFLILYDCLPLALYLCFGRHSDRDYCAGEAVTMPSTFGHPSIIGVERLRDLY
jgi:hypothetical protein